MRGQGIAVVLLVAVLVGCTPTPAPDPTEAPSGSPSPVAEVAPVGESALPLGCADLLVETDVADLGPDFDEPVSAAIDESRIVVDMGVVALQLGTLECIWAARYGATDFHAAIELTVAPTTATALDAAAEQSFMGAFAPADGLPGTLLTCADPYAADETSTLYTNCDIVQLRAGYRLDLETSGLVGTDASVALGLLATIDAAIDAAPPARVVEPVAGTTDPGAVCTSAELAPVLAHLGATGDPVIAPSDGFPGVTQCTWPGVDEYGNPTGPWARVLPGGAWAIPRLGSGVASIFVPTHPSADGSLVIGVGDGVSVWRAVGDDLVEIVSGDSTKGDGWEAFLEATW